ncbi:endo-1,4-beta-xylanase [Neobacillus niacini]|uniref:endo-1,4-beta-xylanase n=1 Tax=Neobacillus niacini TaxID=86668 RepID=UPI00277E4EE9|nr:endo-1,4-beta-xylanase [Neobacillus niacini]MDQ1002779.1 endo-1,4-beta-xylanase [Neobacillus niacini]
MENKRSLKVLIKKTAKGALSLSLSVLLAVPVLNSLSPLVADAATTELPPTGLTYENYPALKDVYKDYFSFGIFGKGEIEGMLYNYASYTPGNEMKPESTQSEKGIFTYTSADNVMKTYSDRNPDMLFYGHTLAWHSQSPTWMWDAPPARYGQPGKFDRETALENLNTHIENVLGHYGSTIEGMDVVNEAIGNSIPGDWKASLAKGEGWYMALGWEWVELAFLKAAEVVDHNGWDVKLIYNDFGLDSPSKARVVYEMVKDINERYAGVRPNGKPLIEVIGMQGHYNLSTNVQNVEENIKLFATLPGVKVNVTEMDIALPPGELTPENENNQGMKYAELFQIYRNYAAGPANTTGNPKVITTVKLAGVRDVLTGWKGGEFAMVYDYDGKAKEALLGILYPAEFLATHNYIDPEKEEQKQIDGVYVYDTSKGDNWSGANIILGNDATQWPWSTTDEGGKVAFTPEKDATYRLSFNYTAKGTTSIRVRWIKDNLNGGYTSTDGANVNSHPYSANQVATYLPAYFNSGMVNMGSYTLTTEIKLDGSQPADGLIGNIAIRGGGGGNAFSINWIKVEKVGAGGEPDTLLVNWPEGNGEEPVDREHPVTTASGVPTDWTNQDVSVKLSATDENSGVAKTEYKINNNEWVPYTDGIQVTTEGVNTVYYRSVDKAGNTEDTKSVVVLIDKTAPTLDFSFNQSVISDRNHKMVPITATVNAYDTISDVATVQLISIVSNQSDNGTGDGNSTQDIQEADFGTFDTNFLIRGERRGSGDRIYTVTYKATDNAGNSTLTTQMITAKHDNSSK